MLSVERALKQHTINTVLALKLKGQLSCSSFEPEIMLQYPFDVFYLFCIIINLVFSRYSAMGQGQAISLLVRAYHIYKKPEYLEAAARGLRVYQNLSQDHGVKAMFLDKYVW